MISRKFREIANENSEEIVEIANENSEEIAKNA